MAKLVVCVPWWKINSNSSIFDCNFLALSYNLAKAKMMLQSCMHLQFHFSLDDPLKSCGWYNADGFTGFT